MRFFFSNTVCFSFYYGSRFLGSPWDCAGGAEGAAAAFRAASGGQQITRVFSHLKILYGKQQGVRIQYRTSEFNTSGKIRVTSLLLRRYRRPEQRTSSRGTVYSKNE